MTPDIEADLVALYATPRGERVLREMETSGRTVDAFHIRDAIRRQRERWSTGGPVRVLPALVRDDP